MDTALVDSEVVDLLSRITGQKLSQRELTPPVIFLAALITVLLGVMLVDGTVTDEEKQRWQTTIHQFIPPKGNVHQLTQLMSQGIRQNQIYKKFDELMTLTAPLSEPEKLLLVSFGYEMSAADGEIDSREKKYLEAIANKLEISQQHLAVLEAGFTQSGSTEPGILEEVQSLLDPAQFHSLDTIFVKAASNILAALPAKVEHKIPQRYTASSYTELKKFQEHRKQLDNHCYQLFQIIQECNDRSILSHTFAEELTKVSQKLQSQRFRVAVVGEFSQGKSTLLNALLGEEIQPVRVTPCSGAVTVLKYGAEKRTVCRYKDGREEEIPLEQYKVKAAISEDAAIGSERNELSHSEIDEIVFTHPGLELCKSGVEIVDSPGLNECDDSTRITNKLLQNTDAVIFLVNALRPLTQWERDKVNNLRTNLNLGNADEPANNLFILVNFWDLLRREKDRQDVRQRIERFFQGQNPIIKGESRIHFISAQAALDVITKRDNNDEYLRELKIFISSLEKFLTLERGYVEIKQSITKIQALIQANLDRLHQAEEVLAGKLKISGDEKEKIIEQIGEASGCDIRIKCLADRLIEEAIDQAVDSFNQWDETLGERMVERSTDWRSNHSHVWSQDRLIQDYADQFIRDLQKEIDDWSSTQLRDVILKQKLEELNKIVYQEIEKLRSDLRLLDLQMNTTFSQQASFKITGIEGDIAGAGGFIGGMSAGGALAVGLFAFTGIGLVPIILAAVAAAITGSFGLGLLDVDGIHDQIKNKILEKGFERLDESMDKISDRLGEIIDSAFKDRIEAVDEAIKQIISCYENVLEQQEKAYSETLEQREVEKAWIAQKRTELGQVKNKIEAILS